MNFQELLPRFDPAQMAVRLTRRVRGFKVLTLVNLLIAFWLYTLYWGERLVFSRSVEQCSWSAWENWPRGASAHHVALVADPQLVDPHTYPGRPWPLASLTIKLTDQYMRKSYRLIQKALYPDTTIFLGDLFDGGREWSTSQSKSPEKQWQRYDDDFWHREYKRFSRMFFDTWLDAGVSGRRGQPSRRRIISNLPGNHDLGFASGIQEPVRKRFNAYFGDGSSIDLVGNHTFVSLDTVSLSAKVEHSKDEQIWRPAQEFLDSFSIEEKKKVATVSYIRQRKHRGALYDHRLLKSKKLSKATLPFPEMYDTSSMPNILLTHVPLYRDQGTPCGDNREHWPPTSGPDGKPLEVDNANSITVARGYQYQNVLSKELSKEITLKIGNISYAFSGDDHDYCDVVHRGYTSAGGGIREITVKSISMAMGVRRPGFQLLSLWNPLREDDVQPGGATLQTHLCLLPDELGILIRYGVLLGLTLAMIVARASYLVVHPNLSKYGQAEEPLLPLVRSENRPQSEKAASSSSDDGSLGSNSLSTRPRVVAKTGPDHARSTSPRPSVGYGIPPPHSYAPVRVLSATPPHSMKATPGIRTQRKQLTGIALFAAELQCSVLTVAGIALPWYFWLLWWA